uniref:EGF-like domain-containing protein n=1 Tax=Capitella teleta TaxID=283909 RepID=X2AJP1_CAPTE
MDSLLSICLLISFAFVLPGSSYALPASVPQPVITQPFDELVTNYVRGTPKDFRYGGGQPTAVAGKLDGAVLLDNGATVYRGFGSEPFGECMCSPELCSNGLSICLWFQQTPDQREASRQYRPNTVFSTGVENVGELIQGSGVGLFLRSSGLMKAGLLLAMVRTPQKQFTADLPAYLFENSSAWHPVCITFKNDTGLKTYYKGQIRDWDEHGLDVTGALTITDRLIFGRPYQRADHYFYGTFDNFFMWTRELDSTQIDDIYQEAPTACEDCDPNAECVVAGEDTTCTCKAGFDGDGRSCQKQDEDVDDTEVDEATKCWLFEEEDSTPDVGETADWNDNGLLTGPGIQGRGVILNGRISWLNAGNFSEKCLSDPGLCASGLTVNYWIRYEGRGNYDNYIFSSGGRGAKNTGFCCWVLGTTMTCRLQKKDRRWQATTEILRGKWQMQTIIWTEEGLQIMIDGVKVGEDVTGRDRTVKKEEPTILAIGSANHYFGLTGRFDMDNLALWYKALTAEEVTAIYKDGVTCP